MMARLSVRYKQINKATTTEELIRHFANLNYCCTFYNGYVIMDSLATMSASFNEFFEFNQFIRSPSTSSEGISDNLDRIITILLNHKYS